MMGMGMMLGVRRWKAENFVVNMYVYFSGHGICRGASRWESDTRIVYNEVISQPFTLPWELSCDCGSLRNHSNRRSDPSSASRYICHPKAPIQSQRR